jgi:hypothetical protein
VPGDTAASAASSSWGRRRSGNLYGEEREGAALYWATGTDRDTMGRSLRSCCPRGCHGKGGPNVKNVKH